MSMDETKKTKVAPLQILMILGIFILGMICGYYFGLTSSVQLNKQPAENNALYSEDAGFDEAQPNTTIPTFSIEGKIQKISGDTITMAPLYSEDDQSLNVKIGSETKIKKTKANFDAENDVDPYEDMKKEELKEGNTIYTESDQNITGKTEFTASLIELIEEEPAAE